MSTIGPGNIGAVNIAGSAAGAQRNDASANRVKENAADRDSQIELQTSKAQNNEDVVEADLTADRDADGRQDIEAQSETVEPDEDNSSPKSALPKNVDPLGERGAQLDLEG